MLARTDGKGEDTMRQFICRTLAAAVLGLGLCTATACHHHDRYDHRYEGPAERAGRHVDHAADKAGDAIEDAGHKVNRALPGD
jgi:hypothetical protein